jgi:predicted TIM-barrel fold metal-dependent hydrolase
MPIIDAYAHVALPRFLSLDDQLRLMDREGVEAALLSTAETCPDLREISRALVAHPDRFRAVGMPLGRSPAHLRDAIRAQLDSGFSGIRLPAAFIAVNPDLLDLLGAAGAFPLVVGEQGLRVAAGLLADFLDHAPGRFVLAGHFAGPADPALLGTDPALARLFDHPGFHVAFTRHGALGHLPLEAWARAVVGRIGWPRVLWGSEWPVALWRDETYRSTLDWALRLNPSAADMQAMRYDNARRLLFARPMAAQPLGAEWDLMALRREADVWLFPPSLNLPEQRHRPLMLAYEAWGGERRGRYSEFVLQMAERGIAARNAPQPAQPASENVTS